MVSDALDEDTLGQRDVYSVDPGPTFQEYAPNVFEIAASTPPLVRGYLGDETADPYTDQGYISVSTQDSNEGGHVRPNKLVPLTNMPSFNAVVTHPPLGDSYHSLGYGANHGYGEGDHHYSCECSSCDTTYCDVGLGEAHSFEPLMAFTSQCSGELGVPQVFDRPSAETELQRASDPPFSTVYLPMVQQSANSTDVLRLLKKYGRGRATCLWMHQGAECGFSSQIDLVKRHIKRVHFKLR